ncbi:MAG: hypothetical protein PHY80_04165 [Rickettsiales bacterium]|nr:hypothetical protein [Rickettsiales bacterium]
MFWIVTLFIINLLCASITRSTEGYIKILSVQGFLLFLVAIFNYKYLFTNEQFLPFCFLAIETLFFKAIAIPLYLNYSLKKTDMYHDKEKQGKRFLSLFIVTCIIIIAFVLTNSPEILGKKIIPLYFGTSIATILTGFWLIVLYKKLVYHMIGYIVIENGILLLSMSIEKEMPLIVNFGVLLDVLVSIIILVFFLVETNKVFQTVNVKYLTNSRE